MTMTLAHTSLSSSFSDSLWYGAYTIKQPGSCLIWQLPGCFLLIIVFVYPSFCTVPVPMLISEPQASEIMNLGRWRTSSKILAI